MDASIGEPFHLASYGLAQRPQKSKAAAKSQRPSAHVFATHEKIASGSRDGYVTVTAQGDGVHVLDLSTLHPVISHTLGPSTSFSCPSVTLGVAENICATYSAIASSTDLAADDCGRTVWMWRENLASPVGDRASQKKKAAVMPHQISDIYTCNGVLLALSPAGDLAIVDTDLRIRGTVPPPSDNLTVSHSFVFSGESSPFLSGPPGSTALVLLGHSQDGTTSIRILNVSGDHEGREIGSAQIPVKSDQIASVSCSSSGYLSIMATDGCWNSFQIESKNAGINVYSAAQPLHLKSLTFIGKSVDEISLVALNTSLVLLAAITSSPTRNIVLLVWDLQYSVLLASHVLAIPSTLSHLTKLSMTLRLVAAASQQALLILSPPAADTQTKSASSSTRSSILVVPLTVPKISTIGNAMGRALAGAPWLVQPGADDTLGPARAKVVATVQSAMASNEPATAERAFFDWEKSERERLSSSGEEEAQVTLGHAFARDLLVAILQPTKQSSAYSSVLVRTLLQRRAISAGMVEGGLLTTFKLRGDWNAIELSTTHVLDLSESDLMFVLQFIASHSRNADAGAGDAMEVDPSPLGAIPTLPSFLAACVRYQTSPAALRAAIHQHLTQPEDVVAVLEVLDGWVGRWKGAEVITLPPKKILRKNEDGVVVLKEGWQKADDGAEYPPLLQVLSFIQTVLDASFLSLLQHSPAHRVLRKVLSRIEPEIQLTEQVELLRGPLEMFARAHAKAVREGKEGKKDQGDWRQRRRLEHERAAMAVGGVYQLEELVL